MGGFYVARGTCGHIIGASSAMQDERSIETDCGDWRARGFLVERVDEISVLDWCPTDCPTRNPSKVDTRIRDLETALNNAADHAKAQEARIQTLEKDLAFQTHAAVSWRKEAEDFEAERDALRAEVGRKWPKRVVELRDENARLRAALDEALGFFDAEFEADVIARIRAIAAGEK